MCNLYRQPDARPGEIDVWMSEVVAPQRPLPNDALRVVTSGQKLDETA
jgi:hypothetical protein